MITFVVHIPRSYSAESLARWPTDHTGDGAAIKQGFNPRIVQRFDVHHFTDRRCVVVVVGLDGVRPCVNRKRNFKPCRFESKAHSTASTKQVENAGFAHCKASIKASAIALARSGGTAFPTWMYCGDRVPVKKKLSGKDCKRAASLGDGNRLKVGWK